MENPGPRPPSVSLLHKQGWRWLIPFLLVLLFLPALIWLPWQAQRMESNERQEQLIADTLWVEQTIRFQLRRDEESLQVIGNEIAAGRLLRTQFRSRISTFLRGNREINRIVWLGADGKQIASSDDNQLGFHDLSLPSQKAGNAARATGLPRYSQPAPAPDMHHPIQLDYHLPIMSDRHYIGSIIATFSTANILEEMVPWWFVKDNEIALTDSDEKLIAKRLAGGPGRGVYTHRRQLDLPGLTLTLYTNSVKNAPRLLPNLLVGSVIALSIGLLWSLWALWRDINRRLAVEGTLRQQVSFRTAMENSLLTGLRARDLAGRVTYVNPAFCQMVGIPADQLVGKKPPMPYWAPEAMEQYQERFARVLAGTATAQFETIFQRANGERFPVLVFESALVDDTGRQTGWMGSILDISESKRIESLSRQQEEKLQAGARLATMGEIASTLAHELNQPLAAISSYLTGALNVLHRSQMQTSALDPETIKPALEKANAQAQRAGQIIRSVHAFVKKRAPLREPVDVQAVVDNVMPLIELQARQYFVVVQTSIVPHLPPLSADQVILEQVMLNLTRNAIDAMRDIPPERRLLRIVADIDQTASQRSIVVSVIDLGHGIPVEVADRLFSPFFSTKADGMGMGLNICRTAIEFHGGTLRYENNLAGGTIFRFSLPAQT